MEGYEALRSSAAIVDLSARGKIKVTGEDRARLLHAMSTNHVQEMKPGDARLAFFLNAQGRILADAWILCFEDHFLLITEPETRKRLFDHLDQYIIADDVALEDVTEAWALVAIEGPEAPRDGLPLTATRGSGSSRLMPAEEKAAYLASLAPLPYANSEAARVVRLELGQPRYGEEITDRFLVQETGQLQAVHFSKGCYLGQEIVERVRSRGQVHRHLRAVRLEGDTPPAVGTKLQPAGELMSAVYSPALGCVVGLAYLRSNEGPAPVTVTVAPG